MSRQLLTLALGRETVNMLRTNGDDAFLTVRPERSEAKSKDANLRFPQKDRGLDVQVTHRQSVVLDELPAGLHVVTHERGEDNVGLDTVLDADLQ